MRGKLTPKATVEKVKEMERKELHVTIVERLATLHWSALFAGFDENATVRTEQ